MDTLFIPTENDFKKWVKDARKESLEDMMIKNNFRAQTSEQLISREEVAKDLGISLVKALPDGAEAMVTSEDFKSITPEIPFQHIRAF